MVCVHSGSKGKVMGVVVTLGVYGQGREMVVGGGKLSHFEFLFVQN